MNKPTDTFKLSNGYEIPCLGFGTWQTPDGDTAVMAVNEAIKNGYRHIDAAACYGNEVGVGKGIRGSQVDRKDLFVTSKVWNTEVFDFKISGNDMTVINVMPYIGGSGLHPNKVDFKTRQGHLAN